MLLSQAERCTHLGRQTNTTRTNTRGSPRHECDLWPVAATQQQRVAKAGTQLPQRLGAMAAYDSVRQRVVVMGGGSLELGGLIFGDVWEF